jgi:uncharacterized protein DUF2798
MAILPAAYEPFVFGVIQASFTTALAAGIATYRTEGFSGPAVRRWVKSWALSWLIMVPFVLFLTPMIQGMVAVFVMP